jgi:hypothetical protein
MIKLIFATYPAFPAIMIINLAIFMSRQQVEAEVSPIFSWGLSGHRRFSRAASAKNHRTLLILERGAIP